jgi:hypothetical protein
MAQLSKKGGKLRKAKARPASPAQGGKGANIENRGLTPKGSLRRGSGEQNPPGNHLNELNEAREQQAATAEILNVIASSPDDVQPAFEAIAERSKRLVNALSTTVFTLEDGTMHLRAFTPTNRRADAALQAIFPASLSAFSWGESISEGKNYLVVDTEHEQGMRDLARLRGYRSMALIPLLRDRCSIGLIGVTRAEAGPFAGHHVQLLQTFCPSGCYCHPERAFI